MFDFFKKSGGLLGMNARNLGYIRPYNRKRGREIADNKLLCKRVLKKNDLGVPALIAKIRNHEELGGFDWHTLPNSFALKPNRGFGGEGILVVYGRRKPARPDDGGNDGGAWIKADGSLVTVDDLKNHIRNILDGSFSLSNIPDIAFFEERLKLLKLFKPYAYKGIPDIRVIVFNRVPVMAMLRLPTRASNGKANLQQGAIGVGIDLATGTTTSAILGKGHAIEYVPGTRLALSGIKIPYWKEILRMSVVSQEVSALGFLGADIAIDRDRGPVILELNARPGLSIQLANFSGLKRRLERVSGLKIKTVERGMRVGMNLFGGEIEEEIEELSGKKIIHTIEKVRILGKDGEEFEIDAKIDTGAQLSSIGNDLARKIGFGAVIDAFEKLDLSEYDLKPENETEIKKSFDIKYKALIPDLNGVAVVFSASGFSLRPKICATFILDGVSISTKINIAKRENMEYRMLVGRRDLKDFLVEV